MKQMHNVLQSIEVAEAPAEHKGKEVTFPVIFDCHMTCPAGLITTEVGVYKGFQKQLHLKVYLNQQHPPPPVYVLLHVSCRTATAFPPVPP
jgi:hypothetical protein